MSKGTVKCTLFGGWGGGGGHLKNSAFFLAFVVEKIAQLCFTHGVFAKLVIFEP